MFNITVMPDGGEPFEVKATSRDVYVWESTGRGRTLRAFVENLALVDCYAIAHIAARRQQLYTGTLEEFTTTCDIDFEEEQPEEPDPTRPGVSPGD